MQFKSIWRSATECGAPNKCKSSWSILIRDVTDVLSMTSYCSYLFCMSEDIQLFNSIVGRNSAIPERLRGVFTTRCYTNLPYLYLTYTVDLHMAVKRWATEIGEGYEPWGFFNFWVVLVYCMQFKSIWRKSTEPGRSQRYSTFTVHQISASPANQSWCDWRSVDDRLLRSFVLCSGGGGGEMFRGRMPGHPLADAE